MNESAQSAGNGPFSKAWRWAELRPRLAIVLVCLMALLPGFFVIPPVDRDESRYAQASRQMLETGDFVEIRFQDEARNKKPAGIYWMQVASATFFGGAQAPIWAYRIPSLLGAIGAALATFWVGAVLFDRRIALLGALLLGTCLSATFEGHIAKTDAMLLFTVVLAQGVMAHAYLSARRGEAAPGWGLTTLFWVAQGRYRWRLFRRSGGGRHGWKDRIRPRTPLGAARVSPCASQCILLARQLSGLAGAQTHVGHAGIGRGPFLHRLDRTHLDRF
jgi:hypothetical protein